MPVFTLHNMKKHPLHTKRAYSVLNAIQIFFLHSATLYARFITHLSVSKTIHNWLSYDYLNTHHENRPFSPLLKYEKKHPFTPLALIQFWTYHDYSFCDVLHTTWGLSHTCPFSKTPQIDWGKIFWTHTTKIAHFHPFWNMKKHPLHTTSAHSILNIPWLFLLRRVTHYMRFVIHLSFFKNTHNWLSYDFLNTHHENRPFSPVLKYEKNTPSRQSRSLSSEHNPNILFSPCHTIHEVYHTLVRFQNHTKSTELRPLEHTLQKLPILTPKNMKKHPPLPQLYSLNFQHNLNFLFG